MHSAALLLVVTASVLHATWNFAAKRVDHGGPVFVWCYYTLSALLLLPVAVAYLLAESVHPRWSWALAAAVSALLHVGYGVVLQRGYTVGDMSVVYPLARGTGPLLTVVVAVLALGERPGALGILGAVAVVVGIGIIGFRPATARTGGRRATSAVHGVLTGVVIAGYTLWDARAVTVMAVPPILYFAASSTAQSLILAPYALARRPEIGRLLRDHLRETVTVAVLSPLAYILVLVAMQTTPVSLVAPVRELSIVIGSLVAWRVLKEPDPARRLVGASVVFAGIVGIAAG